MVRGSCHCGAVTFHLAATPEWLTECNCSICRRLGALWAHAHPSSIEIEASEGSTLAYSWGERTIAFHTCRTCGCTTHWQSLGPEPATRMAVNGRLATPEAVAGVPVRRFDGADTWAFLDGDD